MDIHYSLNPATGVEDPTISPSNGNPATGTPGTYPPYQSVFFTMQEVVNLIEGAGLTPSDADLTQALEAVKALIAQALAAYKATVPPIPSIPTYTGSAGVAIANDNATLDINSLASTATCLITDYLPILASGSDDKISVEALASVILAQAVKAAVSQAYASYVIFTASGTYTPDPACTGLEIQAWAGGGGGAYSGPVVAGGGGGGYSAGRYSIPAGQSFPVIIGAGGAGGTASSNVGGNGGTTEFMTPNGTTAYISATGGQGASVNVGGAGGTGYGGQAVYNGQAGSPGNAPGNGLYFPGSGGASFGAGPNSTTGVVLNGYGVGVGGTGGNSTGAAGATPNGGAGAPGLMIIKQIII